MSSVTLTIGDYVQFLKYKEENEVLKKENAELKKESEKRAMVLVLGVQEWKKKAKEASAEVERLKGCLKMREETAKNLKKLHDRLGHNSYEDGTMAGAWMAEQIEEVRHTILPVDVNGEEFLKEARLYVLENSELTGLEVESDLVVGGQREITFKREGTDECGNEDSDNEEETDYQIWFDGGEEVMGGFKSFEELKDYFEKLVKEMATYGKISIEAPISRPDKMACYAFDKESGECIENLEVEDLDWDIETCK